MTVVLALAGHVPRPQQHLPLARRSARSWSCIVAVARDADPDPGGRSACSATRSTGRAGASTTRQTAAKQAAYDHETIHGGFWGRITRVVMARPVVSLVLAGRLPRPLRAALPRPQAGLGGASALPDELESQAGLRHPGRPSSPPGWSRRSRSWSRARRRSGGPERHRASCRPTLAAATTADGQPLFGPATGPDQRRTTGRPDLGAAERRAGRRRPATTRSSSCATTSSRRSRPR